MKLIKFILEWILEDLLRIIIFVIFLGILWFGFASVSSPIKRIQMVLGFENMINKIEYVDVKYKVPQFKDKDEFKNHEDFEYKDEIPVDILRELFGDIPDDFYSKEENGFKVFQSNLLERGLCRGDIPAGVEYLLVYKKINKEDILTKKRFNIIDMYMLRLSQGEYKVERDKKLSWMPQVSREVEIKVDYNRRLIYDVGKSELSVEGRKSRLKISKEKIRYNVSFDRDEHVNEPMVEVYDENGAAKGKKEDNKSPDYNSDYLLEPFMNEGDYRIIRGAYFRRSGGYIWPIIMDIEFSVF